GLRSVHPSSTRGLTQQHSVRNMLFEYIHGVGTGQSYGKFTMTSSISVVEKMVPWPKNLGSRKVTSFYEATTSQDQDEKINFRRNKWRIF
ncbi:hypothetical protein HID58_038485, partial [Brassica napus]